jgi:pyrimidine nucleoside transport protein
MERGIDNVAADIEMELDPNKSIRIEDLSTMAVKNLDLSSSKSDSNSNDDDDDDDEPSDQSCEFLGNALEKFWTILGDFFTQRSAVARSVFYIILAVLYNAYFIASVYYSIHNGIPMDWCDGVGFLIVLTALIYLGLFYFQIVKKFWGKAIHRSVLKPLGKAFDKAWKYRSVYLFTSSIVWIKAIKYISHF